MIKKGTWVRIKEIVLEPHERAENIPDETKKVPLTMWLKGLLIKDAEIGETVKIITRTGRFVSGILDSENPSYHHNYGEFVPEILQIDIILNDERNSYE